MSQDDKDWKLAVEKKLDEQARYIATLLAQMNAK